MLGLASGFCKKGEVLGFLALHGGADEKLKARGLELGGGGRGSEVYMSYGPM